jgi:hypothetical protein
MKARTHQSTQSLYDKDYQLWLETLTEQLRQGKFSSVDWENLIEELESMGRSDKRATMTLLTRLLEPIRKVINTTTSSVNSLSAIYFTPSIESCQIIRIDSYSNINISQKEDRIVGDIL